MMAATLGPSSLRLWLPRPASSTAAGAGGLLGAWKIEEKKKKSRWLWSVVPLYCTPMQQNPTSQQDAFDESVEDEGVGIMCEPCDGRGWLLCDFCNGQKTNVKAENNRIYRRCPNCRAIGYILCSKCKVFKCIAYPDYSDGNL